MKKGKILFCALLAAIFAVIFVGCSESNSEGMGGSKASPGYSSRDSFSGDVSGDYTAPESGQENVRAGQMTATAWNDNDYYSMWLEQFAVYDEQSQEQIDEQSQGQSVEGQEQGEKKKENGMFSRFVGDNNWGFDTTKRVKVTVKSDDKAVVGAKVTFIESDQSTLTAITDAKGVAYLFPQADEGKVTVVKDNLTQEGTFTKEERNVDVTFEENKIKVNLIKLMFVIDATGSMGDEISYLKAELNDVIQRVVKQSENSVAIDLALLFYRDDGDQEKFYYSDFERVTEGNGMKNKLSVLSKQNATGGGDYEEAVDEALVLAMGKNWGEENSTKLIFHVLDAPAHDEAIYRTRYANAVKVAAAKGIRLNPVLCSGADLICEYTMRQAAIYTGGTIVHITDDSGIGGEHFDPEIENLVVEKLNDLLVRLIVGYHSGVMSDPVPWNGTKTEDEQQQ